MYTLSFMSANYVARQVGYQMTEGWGQGDAATNAYFQPLETFRGRFATVVGDIYDLGFRHMDIWLAHLNPRWATAEHIAIAQEILAEYDMQVASLAGNFGSDRGEVIASCRLAQALHTDILGGNTSLLGADRPALVAILRDHGVRLGVENHPERTPQELLAKIGDGGQGTIGAAVDTGWFGTQGYDAAQAVRELAGHIIHVHMKDVLPPGPPATPGAPLGGRDHVTCAFGDGIVPLEACVRALQEQGYVGALSIEHEPEDRDPTAEVVLSVERLRQWLPASG